MVAFIPVVLAGQKIAQHVAMPLARMLIRNGTAREASKTAAKKVIEKPITNMNQLPKNLQPPKTTASPRKGSVRGGGARTRQQRKELRERTETAKKQAREATAARVKKYNNKATRSQSVVKKPLTQKASKSIDEAMGGKVSAAKQARGAIKTTPRNQKGMMMPRKSETVKRAGGGDITRMNQDALHPAEMKGKPHQSQKAIRALRKKKDEDFEAKQKFLADERKKRAVKKAPKKKSVAASVRQAKPKTTVRNIKARDADKERSARMIGKKAEALRAKNDPNKKVRKSPAQRRTSAMDEKGRQIKRTTTTEPRSVQTLAGLGTMATPLIVGGVGASPLAGHALAGTGPDIVGKMAAKKLFKGSSRSAKKTAKPAAKKTAKPAAKKTSAPHRIVIKKKLHSKGGPVKKDQGYNARLDESMGARNKTKRQQSLKSRRNESEAMEKKGGRRKFAAVKTMDKGSRKKKPRGVGAALKGWGKAHHG